MKVIYLNETTVYLSKLTKHVCHDTKIALTEKYNLVVGFNPHSSLYDEKNFDKGHPLTPFAWCCWWIDKIPFKRLKK